MARPAAGVYHDASHASSLPCRLLAGRKSFSALFEMEQWTLFLRWDGCCRGTTIKYWKLAVFTTVLVCVSSGNDSFEGRVRPAHPVRVRLRC